MGFLKSNGVLARAGLLVVSLVSCLVYKSRQPPLSGIQIPVGSHASRKTFSGDLGYIPRKGIRRMRSRAQMFPKMNFLRNSDPEDKTVDSHSILPERMDTVLEEKASGKDGHVKLSDVLTRVDFSLDDILMKLNASGTIPSIVSLDKDVGNSNEQSVVPRKSNQGRGRQTLDDRIANGHIEDDKIGDILEARKRFLPQTKVKLRHIRNPWREISGKLEDGSLEKGNKVNRRRDSLKFFTDLKRNWFDGAISEEQLNQFEEIVRVRTSVDRALVMIKEVSKQTTEYIEEVSGLKGDPEKNLALYTLGQIKDEISYYQEIFEILDSRLPELRDIGQVLGHWSGIYAASASKSVAVEMEAEVEEDFGSESLEELEINQVEPKLVVESTSTQEREGSPIMESDEVVAPVSKVLKKKPRSRSSSKVQKRTTSLREKKGSEEKSKTSVESSAQAADTSIQKEGQEQQLKLSSNAYDENQYLVMLSDALLGDGFVEQGVKQYA
mmetsp:Transcript_3197/g.5968  ORF Transcript_3197/g.5968 Transcript_3197/m.5968 type:complete len:496 (+) Transcript_3197:129-1616(+)